jgi:hypothetical protein
MTPHVIRLRGPWQIETAGDGLTRASRIFHRPTGLSAESRVTLVVAEATDGMQVMLNGAPLAATPPDRFHLAPHLQPQNMLVLEFPSLVDAAALTQRVRLEIE